MQAQLITYQLKDISQAEYLKQMVEPDAPVLAKVPGLLSLEDFMHPNLVKAVVSRPFVRNVSSADFEVNQKAPVITRGLK